jgi:hypothetical protein
MFKYSKLAIELTLTNWKFTLFKTLVRKSF